MRWSGHWWTVWPVVRSRTTGIPVVDGEVPWETRLEDPDVGEVRLNGRLAYGSSSEDLVVLVHGLGGCIESRYMAAAARSAHQLGLATLRLNLRGADRGGGDLYHAGLSSDLEIALRSPELERFSRIRVLGFSLGGHLAMRLATHCRDPRLKAVAAVCSPIDLASAVDDFDQPQRWLYRKYILSSLCEMAATLDAHPTLEVKPRELAGLRNIRDFDRLLVVRRFGFADTEDYYERSGVVHRLSGLQIPALLVATEGDPMVSARSIRLGLDRAGASAAALTVRWVDRGGHVGFPPDLDLGLETPKGLEGQVLGWLLAAG